MLKNARKLTCEEFQRHVADLINSGADPEDVERHPHAKSCAICRQLLREIEVIEEAARSLFPDEWKTINRPN
jgi:hypothetical protein